MHSTVTLLCVLTVRKACLKAYWKTFPKPRWPSPLHYRKTICIKTSWIWENPFEAELGVQFGLPIHKARRSHHYDFCNFNKIPQGCTFHLLLWVGLGFLMALKNFVGPSKHNFRFHQKIEWFLFLYVLDLDQSCMDDDDEGIKDP